MRNLYLIISYFSFCFAVCYVISPLIFSIKKVIAILFSSNTPPFYVNEAHYRLWLSAIKVAILHMLSEISYFPLLKL